jgi:hypothetical protein
MVMQVEKELGERRAVGYSGVGFAVAPEICYDSLTSSIEDKTTVSPLTLKLGNAIYRVCAACVDIESQISLIQHKQ